MYRAADTRLDRTVAIKLLPDHIASDAELRERFEREARMISSLSHPHICTLYDVGEQDGARYRAISGKTEDQGAFKTPTLREVALTALYMHSGSIGSLDEVSP